MKQAIEVNRLYLRRGVADLVAQIRDERTEALIDRAFLEQPLPAQRIVYECRSHQVRQHFQVAQFGKIPIQFCGQLTAIALQTAVQLEHFCAERFGLDRSWVARLNGIDPCNRKRLFLLEIGKANASQPLQDQIRRAIAASDTGANQSGGGKMKEILRRMPIWATRLDQ